MQATDPAGAISYDITIADCATQSDADTGTALTFIPTAPSISGASLVDTTTGLACVKTGDLMTLSFTTTNTGTSPTVQIAGQNATVAGGPTSWTATYTMQATDPAGAISYDITIADCATQSDADTGTALTFIPTAPSISGASLVDTTTGLACVKTGDLMTLSFSTTNTGTSPTVQIAGQNATVAGGPMSWTATYTMQATDPAGAISYDISIADCAAQSDTDTGTALTFIPTAPVISGASLVDTTTGLACVKTGDLMTLSFTTTNTGTSPTVQIAGQNAAVAGGPTSWTATYTMQATDPAGAISYDISIADCAAQSDTDTGTALTFIPAAPSISGASL